MTKRVVVGDAFDSLDAQVEEAPKSDSAEVIEAKTKANESKTKSNLAYWAVAGGTLSLMASAGFGVYDGTFDEVQSVWNIFGPIVGGVFGHYFGGTGNINGGESENG
ncbi:MAG: hypothetical protein AAFR02_07145 [Pseudomonadota bacterium]